MISLVFGIAAALGVIALIALGLWGLVNDDVQRHHEIYPETGTGEEGTSPDHSIYNKAA